MACEVFQAKPWTGVQMTPLGPHKVYPARVQSAREVRGLSQLEAAARMGTTLGRWRNLESGQQSIGGGELARASMLLNMPLAYFQKPIDPSAQFRESIFMCGDGASSTTCSRCPCLSERLCDFPVGGGRTCDMPLCDECAVEQLPATETAESIDYCPQHALMADDWGDEGHRLWIG